jgi:hypothetical protein
MGYLLDVEVAFLVCLPGFEADLLTGDGQIPVEIDDPEVVWGMSLSLLKHSYWPADAWELADRLLEGR